MAHRSSGDTSGRSALDSGTEEPKRQLSHATHRVLESGCRERPDLLLRSSGTDFRGWSVVGTGHAFRATVHREWSEPYHQNSYHRIKAKLWFSIVSIVQRYPI